jgi:hypothetical protein
VTGPDEEEPWTSDLEPGLYNVRVQADRTYETVLDLQPGERCAVRLSSTDNGGIGFDLHQLVLSSTATEPRYVPSSRISLRTLPGRQAFFVFLKNSSPNAQTLIAEVLAGGNVVGSSLPIRVTEGSITVPVPGFGTPAPKPDEPLAEGPQGLRLRLRDPGTGQVLDEQPLQPAIGDPLEYIEVTRSQFVPARPGEPNRLEVTLRSLPQMAGPPCPVKLDIPADPELFPAFVEPAHGNLEGLLEPGGKTLTLFAEDIKLKPGSSDQGQFSLSVDGIERALWYQTSFVPEGQAQRVKPVRRSRVRFRPVLTVEPDTPARLTIHFKVDNAPQDARLLFRLGHFERGEFKDDIKPWREQAQNRHIRFDPRGEGGALLFEASVTDWSKEFDVPSIRGRRQLRAFLIDERGHDVLTTWAEDLILDDRPRGELAIDVPAEIEEGADTLTARARVTSNSPSIREVVFILRTKADFAAGESSWVIVPGKPAGGDPRVWEALMPLPKDARDKVAVNARATSNSGITTFSSVTWITVRTPRLPRPRSSEARPAAENSGAIVGKVTESDVAQAGLMVYLIDPGARDQENPVKSTVKTAPDGTYSFSDLKPGRYRIFCLKQTTNRRDTRDTTVEQGRTTHLDLDLLLP